MDAVVEQKGGSDIKRTHVHSHITGLGLDACGNAEPTKDGLVAQCCAREAAGVVASLARKRKLAGQAVILAGPSGTGKTAIAFGISKELGPRVPFCSLSGSEVYSAEVKKTEILTEAFRKAVGVRIRNTHDVYEGEVSSLVFNGAENAFTDGGRQITEITVVLSAAKGKKTLRLDPSLYEELGRQKIRTGDIITIDARSGSVKRAGRSETHSKEHDIENDVYLPLPSGEVRKTKEITHSVSLHDLDAAHACPKDGQDVLALINKMKKTRKTEIPDKLRLQVNYAVNDLVQNGSAEVIPGVLFLDEAHMLDTDCFSFLNRLLETPTAPLVILATNKTVAPVRGIGGTSSVFGIPSDFLDRLLVIQTSLYLPEETKTILALRASIEDIRLSEDAAAALSAISQQTSLRYSIQLLAPSKICASCRGECLVDKCDVEEAFNLFYDAKRSVAEQEKLCSALHD